MTTEPNDDNRIWRELRTQRDILVELKTMVSALVGSKDDHEQRIRSLEARSFPWGQAAAIATVVAGIVTLIALYTSH